MTHDKYSSQDKTQERKAHIRFYSQEKERLTHYRLNMRCSEKIRFIRKGFTQDLTHERGAHIRLDSWERTHTSLPLSGTTILSNKLAVIIHSEICRNFNIIWPWNVKVLLAPCLCFTAIFHEHNRIRIALYRIKGYCYYLNQFSKWTSGD